MPLERLPRLRSLHNNHKSENVAFTVIMQRSQVTFRFKLYQSLEELQTDLDAWLHEYNTERTHQGKMCCGRTPMQTLIDGKTIWMEKVGQLN